MKRIIILIMILSSLSYSQELIVLLDSDYKNKETREILASLTTPISSSYAKTLDRFISMVKDSLAIANLSDAFDVMYLFANETSEAGLKNLVKRSHDATAVNSPTFTQWEGFTGNGVSSYINTNYNPATQGVSYTLNSASVLYYTRANDITDGVWNLGSYKSSVPVSGILIGSHPTGYGGRTIFLNSGDISYAQDGSIGLRTMTRLSNTAVFLYINNNLNYSFSANTVSIPPYNIYILANCTDGAPVNFVNSQMSFTAFGRGLTASEVSKLTNCVEWYMDSLGRGVIP